MDFVSVFKKMLPDFKRQGIDCALIGGFALQAAGITRTTDGIDMLIAADGKEKLKTIIAGYGYKLLHESDDVLNFSADSVDLGRIDFLLAHRTYASRMLERAEPREILNGEFTIKVVTVEDQIGLKVQSSSSDSTRFHRDMADIEALMKMNYAKLDMSLLREYFALFEREPELDALLEELKDA